MERVDPITFELLNNLFLTITDEMWLALVRSSYSPGIKEREDCSCALFDAQGNCVAQGEHNPVHLGSLLGLSQAILSPSENESIHKGDIFLANDPYVGGGAHLNDITVSAPVYQAGKLMGFVSNIGHHQDIGGRLPASYAGDNQEIFQEGVRLSVMKLCHRGEFNQDLIGLIAANVRTPETFRGDLSAQIAACRTGERRLLEAVKKYGREALLAGMRAVQEYSEKRMREEIEKIPDGVYEYEDAMDDDGMGGPPKAIRVCAEVAGDQMKMDFSGTDPQAQGAINLPRSNLKVGVYFAVRCFTDPTIPPNSGCFRPVIIQAGEKGTVVNPRFPAAVGARSDTMQRVADVVIGALAQALPERAKASGCGCTTVCCLSGRHPQTKQVFVYEEVLGGGDGGRPGKDGLDGVQTNTSNSINLPVEVAETEFPVRIERHKLVPHSGGRGRWPGGRGLQKDIRVLADGVSQMGKTDRQKMAPPGLFGGQPGQKGKWVLNPGTKREKVLNPRKPHKLKRGDLLRIITPGGGGYGKPAGHNPGTHQKNAGRSNPADQPLIRIRNLKKHFPVTKTRRKKGAHIRAVDGVSLDIYPGEVLGLVGESGCGKSTLGRTILRLEEPTEGQILFKDLDITHLSWRQLRPLRTEMQIIFQDPYASLNPRQTVKKILSLPLKLHFNLTAEEKEKKVFRLMEQAGLSCEWAGHYPHQFSGGQRQRIGIARALAVHPRFIVADEPVAALDISIQAQIMNLLKNLQREFDLTYLLIAHDLAVIAQISDRIAVMYLGKIVETGTRNQIIDSPQHPYTRLLLDSVLEVGQQPGPKGLRISGETPTAVNPPSGCRFHPRCPLPQVKDCTKQEPELRSTEEGRLVACHLAH
ncbi:MAG: oligopeptide/dipeptide ABC transporter ATP-binding protein [Candidatus Aminicenantes bacterium]